MPWRENEGKANKVKGSTPEDGGGIVYRLMQDISVLSVVRNSSRQPVLYGGGIAISILGEHLITGHHLLDLATVFALLKPKGGNKGKMHLLFGG